MIWEDLKQTGMMDSCWMRTVAVNAALVREGGRWGDFPEARLKMTPNRGQKSGLRT